MLPEKTILSSRIQQAVKSNTDTDPDKAIKTFGDNLAQIILDTLKQADVILQPGAIQTIVTTTGGSGTGISSNQSIGSIQ